MNSPLVSVVISTHNRANYLVESVGSVLAQTFTDFELIICDDASRDETPAVCRDLERQDSRVRVLRHEHNLGMVGNWNSGLHASSGRYFCKLDDDNHYLPTFLEKAVQALRTHPEATFVFSDEWFIDEEGRRDDSGTEEGSQRYGRSSLRSGLQPDTAVLAARQSCGINATLFVREALTAVGGFRPFGPASDMDLFLNMASHSYRAVYIPERLMEYRYHSQMDTLDLVRNVEKARAVVRVWEAHSYQGEAERIRFTRLIQSYISLGRTLLLGREVGAARQAVVRAFRMDSKRPKTLFFLGLLSLPQPLLRLGLRLRYGEAAGAQVV